MPRDSDWTAVASASVLALVARAGCSRPSEVVHARAGKPDAALCERFEPTLMPGCHGGT